MANRGRPVTNIVCSRLEVHELGYIIPGIQPLESRVAVWKDHAGTDVRLQV
jgi:hypothetical protein